MNVDMRPGTSNELADDVLCRVSIDVNGDNNFLSVSVTFALENLSEFGPFLLYCVSLDEIYGPIFLHLIYPTTHGPQVAVK